MSNSPVIRDNQDALRLLESGDVVAVTEAGNAVDFLSR
jgi:hypothetical protein